MALRNRIYYAEQILNQLKLPLQNRDDKIDIREVYAAMDNWLNERAKMGFFENMKLRSASQMDEQFITTFEELAITDPPAKKPSYMTLPANYTNLPDNQGIQDVFFMNNTSKKKYFDPVLITSYRDIAGMRHSMAFDNQGRLSVAPYNGKLLFSESNVGATYGNAGVRLVIKSAFDIADDAPFPVPADEALSMVSDLTEYFLSRNNTGAANIRDNNDSHES